VSHYSLEELIELWKREKLAPEQMIGQVLQILREHERRLRDIARRAPGGGDRTSAPPR
jgi:hypothetical protein